MRQIDLNKDWAIVIDATYIGRTGQTGIISDAVLYHKTCNKPRDFGRCVFISYIVKYHKNPHPFILCCEKRLTKKLFNKLKFLNDATR